MNPLAELLTAVMAVIGFFSSAALLVLNLKVSNAVAGVRVEMANLRAEHKAEAADHYRQVMDNMTRMVETLSKTYANREVSDEKHLANIKRLDGLERQLSNLDEKLDTINERLHQRISDISGGG